MGPPNASHRPGHAGTTRDPPGAPRTPPDPLENQWSPAIDLTWPLVDLPFSGGKAAVARATVVARGRAWALRNRSEETQAAGPTAELFPGHGPPGDPLRGSGEARLGVIKLKPSSSGGAGASPLAWRPGKSSLVGHACRGPPRGPPRPPCAPGPLSSSPAVKNPPVLTSHSPHPACMEPVERRASLGARCPLRAAPLGPRQGLGPRWSRRSWSSAPLSPPAGRGPRVADGTRAMGYPGKRLRRWAPAGRRSASLDSWRSAGEPGRSWVPPLPPALKNPPEPMSHFSQTECMENRPAGAPVGERGRGALLNTRSESASPASNQTLVAHTPRSRAVDTDRMANVARLLRGPRRRMSLGGRCSQPAGPIRRGEPRRSPGSVLSAADPGRARPRRPVYPSCPATGRASIPPSVGLLWR